MNVFNADWRLEMHSDACHQTSLNARMLPRTASTSQRNGGWHIRDEKERKKDIFRIKL